MNALPENSATLEAPESVNLVEEASSHFSVNVNDEDKTNVPADLGPQEAVPFWKKSDVRMWLYILGGTVLIFLIVFTILSQQTSLFKGYLLNDTETTTSTDDEDVFGGFNNSASDDEPVGGDGDDDDEVIVGGGSGSGSNANNGNTSSGNDDDDDDEEVIVGGGSGGSSSSPIIDDVDFEEGTGAEASDDEEDLVFNDDNEEDLFLGDNLFIDDIGSLLADVPGDIPPVYEQPTTPTVNGNSLGSNTNANIMSSPDVQGDTGPAVGVAMIPTVLYAFVRRRKR